MATDFLFLGSDPGGANCLKLLNDTINNNSNYKSIYTNLNQDNLLQILSYIKSCHVKIIILGTSIQMKFEELIIKNTISQSNKPKIFFYIDENYNVENRLKRINKLKYIKSINGIFYQFDTIQTEFLKMTKSYIYGSPILDTRNDFFLNQSFQYSFNSKAKWVIIDEFKESFFLYKGVSHKKSFLSDILKKNNFDLSKIKIRHHPRNTNKKNSFIAGITGGFIGYSSFFLSIAFLRGFSVVSIADNKVQSVALNQFPIQRKSIKDLKNNIVQTSQNLKFHNKNEGSTTKIINCLIRHL